MQVIITPHTIFFGDKQRHSGIFQIELLGLKVSSSHLGGSFKGILAIAAVPLEDLHLKHPADHDERHKGQDSQGQLPREDEADDQCRPDTRQGLCHRAQTCTCHLVVQKKVSLFVGRCEWWGFKVLFFSS